MENGRIVAVVSIASVKFLVARYANFRQLLQNTKKPHVPGSGTIKHLFYENLILSIF